MQIEGAFGLPFEISRRPLKGICTYICAGTGVLPILDFLFGLYLCLKREDPPPSSFHLKLIGSFRYGCVPGRELILALLALKSTYFSVVLNFSSPCHDFPAPNTFGIQFTESFLAQNLLPESQMFYICGPPSFGESCLGSLQSLGVPSSSIEWI